MGKDYKQKAFEAAVSLAKGAGKTLNEGKTEDAYLIMDVAMNVWRTGDPIPRVICEC